MFWIVILIAFWAMPLLAAAAVAIPGAFSATYRRWLAEHLVGSEAQIKLPRSTGPHLHYEVRMAGEPVDPAPFMAR